MLGVPGCGAVDKLSVQTLDQRLAELCRLRAAIDDEIARVESAIATAMRRVRPKQRRRSRHEIPPCGTDSAYHRHRHYDEPIDDACREAHAAYERERTAARRRVAGQQPWRAAS